MSEDLSGSDPLCNISPEERAVLLAVLGAYRVARPPARPASDTARRYYTAEDNPLGSARAFLDAGRRGDFPAFKIGRRVAALVSDVHAAIESRARRREQIATIDPSDEDLLQRAGLRPVAGRGR